MSAYWNNPCNSGLYYHWYFHSLWKYQLKCRKDYNMQDYNQNKVNENNRSNDKKNQNNDQNQNNNQNKNNNQNQNNNKNNNEKN